MNQPHTHEPAGGTGILAALTYIDNVGFHGIATNLTGLTPKIDRNWTGLIRNARIAVAATSWPDHISAQAQTFIASAVNLIAALEQRDTTVTKEPAGAMHLAYHTLSDAGWQHLADLAGVDVEEHGHHHHPG